ncbi:dienelactone hydrolase family protein [Leifsonia sp. TF02-11]|uniref:dienelactone hydrolase family protein n=1 Tax=Leifsonia sp. TF02-11 TaxID=2815212 RepID=UPI001FB5D8B3|nr:dienelactone hydrolase family protein [Leifsonia sp. TF02-11]
MALELTEGGPLPEPFHDLLATVPVPAGSDIRVARVPYSIDGADFEGFIALDRSLPVSGPAVLLLHAWSGVGPNVEMRAQMLARLGYVAFAADLYGAGIRPGTPAEAKTVSSAYYRDLPLLADRATAGLDTLARMTGVEPGRVSVAGYCFGGTAALELARSGAPVAGIASFHGTLLGHEPADAGRAIAPLLIVAGGSDDIVPDAALLRLLAELRTSQRLSWEVDIHGGAPHAFTVPGTERFRPGADARSWGRFQRFLAETNPTAQLR